MSLNNLLDIVIILLITIIYVAQSELNFNNDVENNKNFKSVPTTVKTYENDTVLLPCYQNTQQSYVRWHRDELLIADSRHPEIPAPERYHLWANGSLQVSRVNAEDTGEFYCEVMGLAGEHAVQLHSIEVQYPPAVISSPSGLVELPVGAIFEIICEAKGIPHPVITWRRSGTDVMPAIQDKIENRKRLLIEVESRDLSGPIECIAENGVGEPSIAGIHLNVLFTPEVKVNFHVVHTKINMRAHLECIVLSAPAAKVHWFHHGVPVITDIRITRHDTEIHSNRSLIHYYTESRHQLVIKKIRDHDLGIYECRAENKIGFKGQLIELTGRPMACIFKISPVVQSGTAHNLIWQTESLSPIVEYKLKFRQIPSGNITPRSLAQMWNELTIPAEFSDGPIHTISYTLRGLQPASVYEVAVLARNRFGWSDNSKIVRFATGGEVELNYSTESMYSGEIEDNFITDVLPSVHQYRSKNKAVSVSINYKCTIIIFMLLVFNRNFHV